jgi:hypothetical protein
MIANIVISNFFTRWFIRQSFIVVGTRRCRVGMLAVARR